MSKMAKIIDEHNFRNKIHVFDNRLHAGELLAKKLKAYEGKKNVYLLAIPAGGVQVAFIISKKLHIPLDLAITRKIHIPWNKEMGFGAISWNGIVFLNEQLVASLGLKKAEIDQCVAEEMNVIRRRMKIFRVGKPFPNLKDKRTIIVDDGLASGYSMLTTVKALESMKVKDIVIAVPTAPVSAIELIRSHVSEIICLNIRSNLFFAVADAYKVWYDLKDEDVIDVLRLIKYYNSALSR